MSGAFEVRRAGLGDVERMVEWADREGWNPDAEAAGPFFAVDPTGFFLGMLDGEMVGCASAVLYDDAFAFFGHYIVAKEHRGKGFGMALTQARLDYVGDRAVGLEGVLPMVERYKRLGFQLQFRTLRYSVNSAVVADAVVPPPTGVVLEPAASLPFPDLVAYDARYFPASRPAFLHQWISQKGAIAFTAQSNAGLVGFGVVRRHKVGWKVGPFYADTLAVAEVLLTTMAGRIPGVAQGLGGPLSIDVPTRNRAAVALAERFGMKVVFETDRMVRGTAPPRPLAPVFGLTTLELG
ncbi:MAG: GNAT family N-acetyltransferase [Planctomycetia bacterium]